jgi:hypothetical protein
MDLARIIPLLALLAMFLLGLLTVTGFGGAEDESAAVDRQHKANIERWRAECRQTPGCRVAGE